MRQRPLPVYRIEAIKDEPVPPTIIGLPDNPDYAGKLFAHLPVAYTVSPNSSQTLSYNGTDTLLESPDDITIRQLSGLHGRSFEIIDPSLPEVWFDENGQLFSSLNLKGNNFSLAALIETATASEGLIAYGLQESATSRRILRGSRLLRNAGVTTEKILGIAEPVFFPTPVSGYDIDFHTELSLGEYKKRLVLEHWKSLDDEERSPEKLAEFFQKLGRVTFYITLRAMDTSYRISELKNIHAREHVFTIANKHFKPAKARDYDPSVPGDMDRLMRQVTLPRAAANFVAMHAAEMAAGFPVTPNMTALGSVVDLDSLHGEPLDMGDEPITALDIVQDLEMLLEGLNEMQMFSHRHMPYSKIFLRLYKKEALARSDTMPFSLQEIAAAAYEHRHDRDPKTLFSTLSQIGRGVGMRFMIAEEFGNYSIRPKLDEGIKRAYEEFLANNTEDIITHTVEGIKEHIVDFCDILLSEIEEEKPGMCGFDMWLDDTLERFHNSGEFLYDTICEKVSERFLAMYADIPKDQLKRDIVTNGCRAFGLPSDLYVSIYEAFKAAYLTELRERTTVREAERLLGAEHDSRIAFRCVENIYANATEFVPLEDLLDTLESKSAIRITLEPHLNNFELIKKSAEEDYRYDYNYEVTSPDATVIEMITDGFYQLLSQDYGEEKVGALYAEVADPFSYAAYVEKHPDGSRHVVIQIVAKNKNDAESWQALSRQEIIAFLRDQIYEQGELFDGYDYEVAKKFEYEDPILIAA